MAYKNVYIGTERRIRVTQNQLFIDEASIPLEDINSVMIENRQCSVSTYALSEFSKYGIATYVCDEKHLPAGVLVPINRHSRYLEHISLQLDASKPLLKRIWQTIVVGKITNQALCLQYAGKDNSDRLQLMVSRVQSGDKANTEARAAALHFRSLFGDNFVRREDSLINAALNYGYSIIRGNIARSTTSYGFEPCLGINHSSNLNQFNLVDDFIECYRPLVDLFVFMNFTADHTEDMEEELSPDMKKRLFGLLNYDVSINGGLYTVASSINILISSYLSSLTKKENAIQVPRLVGLREHRYE